MTQTVAIEALHKCFVQPGATEVFVSRNEALAQDLVRTTRISLDSIPRGLEEKWAGKRVKDNEQSIEWQSGSRIRAEASASAAGRGIPATDLYLDEFAALQFAQAIYQAAAPGVSRGGRITVISTPKGRSGPGGMFYVLWASRQGEKFSRHTCHWSMCPEFNPDGWWLEDPAERKRVGEAGEWYGAMRPDYTESQWAEEFDCDFLASGNAVFREEDIDAMQVGWDGWQEPEPGHLYIKAWDIGSRQDATVGTVLDISDYPAQPVQIAAFVRGLGWGYPRIVREIEQTHRKYRGWTYIETNGPGDPVLDMVDCTDVQGYTTTKKSKEDAISALKLLLESKGIKGYHEQLDTELRLYVEDDKDLTQDCVMSLAIGARQIVEPRARGDWSFGNARLLRTY